MATKLPDAKVYRGGVTARQLTLETVHAEVRNPKPGDGVCTTFQLSSKGGGTIQIQFQYGTQSYEPQLRAMLQNDRHGALSIMAKVMHEEMNVLGKHEAEATKSARDQIIQAADRRLRKSDGTDEAIAMIVCDKVRTIVRDIEATEKESHNRH